HPVGDEVLKKTAEAASTSIRKTDMVFRIGGEEFAVLLPNTDLEGAKEVAEKLRCKLEKYSHPLAGKFTASFGVGERSKGESFNLWYKEVDQALYQAKREGRNRVVNSTEIDYTKEQ
ncbi:MAG: GGDEF domain-containing protein, partial [Solirubrobacterales bacterium]